MRNPIRLKNLSLRFAPWYGIGALLLITSEIRWPQIALGFVPLATGLAIRAWGAGHLVKNECFTTTGPYAHLRHPLYLGTILVAMGFALMLGGFATWIVLGGVLGWFTLDYFPRKERVESRRLEERYGEAFRLYRAQVPAIVPRLHAWQPAPVDAGASGSAARWSAARYDRNNELGTFLAVAFGVACVAARAALG